MSKSGASRQGRLRAGRLRVLGGLRHTGSVAVRRTRPVRPVFPRLGGT
ncbi:hypothetical protein Rhow_001407 [Rhodococcus wratislaviensis]|uniref:Uncharacterized protein n=1 Tax=Rhodococcus wratislaviensis TaxID=44752 RepID=A0A402C3Z1_RHOWR|nr:hypothetical protein Rhow_001407 [Rhodococcus wratislaviensis]